MIQILHDKSLCARFSTALNNFCFQFNHGQWTSMHAKIMQKKNIFTVLVSVPNKRHKYPGFGRMKLAEEIHCFAQTEFHINTLASLCECFCSRN